MKEVTIKYQYWKPGDPMPDTLPEGCEWQSSSFGSWHMERALGDWSRHRRRWPKPAAALPYPVEALSDAVQALDHALHRLKDDGVFSTAIALKLARDKAQQALDKAKPGPALPVEVPAKPAYFTKACPQCFGSGRISQLLTYETCKLCNGRGCMEVKAEAPALPTCKWKRYGAAVENPHDESLSVISPLNYCHVCGKPVKLVYES